MSFLRCLFGAHLPAHYRISFASKRGAIREVHERVACIHCHKIFNERVLGEYSNAPMAQAARV
jgi:hypothetical protein